MAKRLPERVVQRRCCCDCKQRQQGAECEGKAEVEAQDGENSGGGGGNRKKEGVMGVGHGRLFRCRRIGTGFEVEGRI